MGLVDGEAARRVAPALRPCDARCRLGRLHGLLRLVNVRLGGKRGDCFLRRLLWLGHAAFPAVHRGEGDTEPLSKLLLREIKSGSNGAEC